AQKSPASCPKYNYDSPYFHQLQIRSADELMTICEKAINIVGLQTSSSLIRAR
ncbi:hypothetical protein C8J56DRAFT_776843, partial [Mycena floridula]